MNKSLEKGAQFKVNHKFDFHIGDKNLKVKNIENQYYAIDDIEIGKGNMIPLWLFGFLF